MWESQLQHCAILQTNEDAGFDGDKTFVDWGSGELPFGKRFAIRATQCVQQSPGTPFEAAQGICLVHIVRASPNQHLATCDQDCAGSDGQVVPPDHPVIGRGTAIGPKVAPLDFFWHLPGMTVEAEHGKSAFAGNVKLEVTRALTVANTIGVIGVE